MTPPPESKSEMMAYSWSAWKTVPDGTLHPISTRSIVPRFDPNRDNFPEIFTIVQLLILTVEPAGVRARQNITAKSTASTDEIVKNNRALIER